MGITPGGLAARHPEERERSYLFIDGGYLRALCRDVFLRIFRTEMVKIDLARVFSSVPCSNAFYYDCVDEQRKDEDRAAFSLRETAQEDEFNLIRSLPGFHVIEGTLSARRRKEVDVALAVDVLTHAYNRNMGWAHLIAGDLDFHPLVQALVKLGVYVKVWSRPTSLSPLLRWAADDAQDISVGMLHSWSAGEFQTAYPLPIARDDSAPIGETVRFGEYHGISVVMLNHVGEHAIRVPETQPFRVVHQDREVLQSFFELEYGKIQWT